MSFVLSLLPMLSYRLRTTVFLRTYVHAAARTPRSPRVLPFDDVVLNPACFNLNTSFSSVEMAHCMPRKLVSSVLCQQEGKRHSHPISTRHACLCQGQRLHMRKHWIISFIIHLPRPVETMYPRIRWRGHAGIITHRASRIMHHGPIAIESDELLLAESVPIVSEAMVMCRPQYEIREM